MAIDRPNDFLTEGPEERAKTYTEYQALGLSTEPFKYVKYYIPYASSASAKQSTFLTKDDIENYLHAGQLKKIKYIYSDDKENIEMMFSGIDDPAQTMESIISKIIDNDDRDFGGLSTWSEFMDTVAEKARKGSAGDKGDISVLL